MGPQQRGRLTNLPDRQKAVTLIQQAQRDGARLAKACELLNLHVRTYHRWTQDDEIKADQRPRRCGQRPKTNTRGKSVMPWWLYAISRNTAVDRRRSSLPISSIKASTWGRNRRCIAYYANTVKIIVEGARVRHNASDFRPRTTASGPNETWSWNITWLPGPTRGIKQQRHDGTAQRILSHRKRVLETAKAANP